MLSNSSERKCVVASRVQGEPVLYYQLLSAAWDECVELQEQDKQLWIGKAALSVQNLDRKEILVLGTGGVIGGLVLVHEQDIHVGDCASVIWQYVLPEYRHTGVSAKCMRLALSIAKEHDAKVLAFSRRVGDWHYEIKYRKLR